MADFEQDKIANYIKQLLDQVVELTTRVKQLEQMQQGIGNVQLGVPFAGRFNAIAAPRTYIVHVTSLDGGNQRFFGKECKPNNSATTPWTVNTSLGLLEVKYPNNMPAPALNDFVVVQYTGTYGATIATPVYGYIDRANSTDIVRFSLLNTLTLNNTATANILTWSSTQFINDTTIVVAADVLQGIWGPAKPGARGWAIRLQDRNVYEVMFMQRLAAFIDFTLTTAVATTGVAYNAIVNDYWRGYAPTSQVTVQFGRHIDLRYYSSGDRGIAAFDETDNLYKVIDSDQRLWISESGCATTLVPTAPTQRVSWLNFGMGIEVTTLTSAAKSLRAGMIVQDTGGEGGGGPYRIPQINFDRMLVISSITSCLAVVGCNTYHTSPRTFTFVTTVYCSAGVMKGGIQTAVINEHGWVISMNSPSYP